MRPFTNATGIPRLRVSATMFGQISVSKITSIAGFSTFSVRRTIHRKSIGQKITAVEGGACLRVSYCPVVVVVERMNFRSGCIWCQVRIIDIATTVSPTLTA